MKEKYKLDELELKNVTGGCTEERYFPLVKLMIVTRIQMEYSI